MTSGPRLGLHLVVRCAKTGATVELSRVEDPGNPWVLKCRSHNVTGRYQGEQRAKDDMVDTAAWCGGCAVRRSER